MAVSANRLELLQIADAVAREKQIDRRSCSRRWRTRSRRPRVVRATARPGPRSAPRSTRSPRDPPVAPPAGRRRGRERRHPDRDRRGPPQEPGRPARRLDRRDPAALFDFGRIAAQSAKQVIVQKVREAESVTASSTSTRTASARSSRPGEARRIRQCHRRPRPWRGHHPPRRADPREMFRNGDRRPRLSLRRPPRAARAADLPVAHPSAVHGQALRPGGSGDL